MQDGEGDVAADVAVLGAIDLVLPVFVLPLALVGPAQGVEGVGVWCVVCVCVCVCEGKRQTGHVCEFECRSSFVLGRQSI